MRSALAIPKFNSVSVPLVGLLILDRQVACRKRRASNIFSLQLADAPLVSATNCLGARASSKQKPMSRFGRQNHSGKHQDSDEANRWYGLMWWKKRRVVQLRQHPLCALCLEQSLIVPASVVDHVEPHHGDWQLFRFGRLQSLCTTCHDSIKRTVEQRGYSTAIGLDGWPTDRANHPAFASERKAKGNPL